MDLLDPYARVARLTPATFAMLPAILAAALLLPTDAPTWAKIVPLVIALGLPVFASQLVQDRGNAIQDRLWAGWGGPPTTQLLRNADNPEPERRDRRRADAVRVAGSDLTLPTPQQEIEDPAGADAEYAHAVGALRTRTRDRNAHPIVFSENVAYGFRRNCLAIRPVALSIAGIVAIICITTSLIIILAWRQVFGLGPGAWAFVAAMSALAWLIWWQIVTPDWVRQAAFRYAHALFDASSGL